MKEIIIEIFSKFTRLQHRFMGENIIIKGEIDKIFITYNYDKLDLSMVKCNRIYYGGGLEGESIKNHILPNSLKY